MEEKYIKRFDEWNNKKKMLNERAIPDSFFFLEREIWWTSIGVNIGKEIDGKHENFERPVLIIKKFSEDTFLGLPISTKENVGDSFHTMIYHKEKRYISLRQINFLSINRLQRLISRMEEVEFIIVKDKVSHIFS